MAGMRSCALRTSSFGSERDDGEGANLLARGTGPPLVQAGRGKEFGVEQMDEVRHFARGRGGPFVETVHRHQTAPLAERGAEGGLFGDRLGARIDHAGANLRVLRPVRDEPPAPQFETRRTRTIDAVHGQRLRRCGVVRAGKIDLAIKEAEWIGVDLLGALLHPDALSLFDDIAATHVGMLPPPLSHPKASATIHQRAALAATRRIP